jgi:O-antigen/teichoic acid export membrane protein
MGKTILASAGMGISMALAYAFHLVLVRMLSPASYGELSTLNALMVIATLPIMSVQGLISREVAKLEKKGQGGAAEGLVRKYLKKTMIWGGIVALVLSLVALMLLGGLSPLAIGAVLTLSSIPFAYGSAVINGYFQGKEKILELTALYNAPALVKLILAIVFVLAGFELVGATASFPLGFVLVVFPAALLLGWLSGQEKESSMDVGGSFIRILATNILMVVFIHSDLFAVRILMGPEAAAFYNTAGITARIPFYISNSVVFVLLPQASKLNFGDKKELLKRFLMSLLFIVPLAPVFILFSKPLLSMFYGPLYAQNGAGAFSILALAMVIFGAANFLVNILWSQRKEMFALVLSALIMLLNLFFLYSLVRVNGLEGAATATLFSSIAFFVVAVCGVVYYSVRFRK